MDFCLPTISSITGLFAAQPQEQGFQTAQHSRLTTQARLAVGGLTLAFAAFLAIDWISSASLAEFLPFVALRLLGIVTGLVVLLLCRHSAPPQRKYPLISVYSAVMFFAFVGIVALDPGEATVNDVSVLIFLMCIYFVLPNNLLPASLVAWTGTAVFLHIEHPAGAVEASGTVALLILANTVGMAMMLQFHKSRRRDFAARLALEQSNSQLLQEIDAHRRTADELRAATRAAEAANDAKSRFLAVASHDLRQPVQAINLFVGALAAQALPPKSARDVERLGQAAEALNLLLDTLLDISRLDAGLIAPRSKPIRLDDLLRRMEDQFTPAAENKNLRLRRVRTSATVVNDEILLERILSNLLSNAINYTHHGGIVFGVRRRAGALILEVWDSGIGIPPNHLPRIYDEFHQVANKAHNRTDGLGLGLSIVHRLTRLLGGTISARSVLGHGSCFIVALPADNQETP